MAASGPRDGVSLARAGFIGNPVGFRAVRLIAEAAAALPLVLQDAEARYERHPLLDLLARPNPAQGRAELLEALYGQLLLSGNAYVEAVPDAAGGVQELHVLRADRMRVIPGADGWPVGYEYRVGGRAHRFAMENGAARSAISGRFTRRMTITACRRWKRRRARSMCITRRRTGPRGCWTMPRGPPARSCTRARMAMAA